MNANDPINPCIESINHAGTIQIQTSDSGLDLKTHLAAMAMQGMLSNYHVGGYGMPYAEIAKMAIAQADALISELNKK